MGQVLQGKVYKAQRSSDRRKARVNFPHQPVGERKWWIWRWEPGEKYQSYNGDLFMIYISISEFMIYKYLKYVSYGPEVANRTLHIEQISMGWNSP